MHETLLTKEQALHILQLWRITEPLPTKGKRMYIFLPQFAPPANVATVEWTDKLSTYGKRLYKLVIAPSLPVTPPEPKNVPAVNQSAGKGIPAD